jgi:hypothetical protein
MFSLAQALTLELPITPRPMTVMLSFPPGGVWPGAPGKWRGTMLNKPVAAVVVTNRLLLMVFFMMCCVGLVSMPMGRGVFREIGYCLI